MKSFNSFLLLLCVVFLSSSVFALSWNICIDKQAPEAPEGLSASDNVVLDWSEAVDSPESTSDCTFGIEYYNIYLDGELIGTSSGLSYSGSALEDGIYVFGVSGVDKAGNEGDRAIREVVFPLTFSPDPVNDTSDNSSSDTGSSRGSSRSSSSSSSSSSVMSESSPVDENTTIALNDDDYGFSGEDFEDEESSDDGFFSFVTGAVVGGSGNFIAAFVFILLLLVLLFLVAGRRKREKVVVSAPIVEKKVAPKKKSVARKGVASKKVRKK